MASENWRERLEAYLDGELDAAAAATFDAETAAAPALQAELAARHRFRDLARGVLRDETATAAGSTHAAAAAATSAGAARRAAVPARRRRVWAAIATAAALALAVMAPSLWRRTAPTSLPPAPAIRAGQVVAVRFGEIPNTTVTLEVGSYDHATDTVH